MITTKRTLLSLVPLYIIIIGLIVVSIQHIISRQDSKIMIESAPASIQIELATNGQIDRSDDEIYSENITFTPITIRFDRLNHVVPVIEGVYDYSNDSWSLSNDKAHIMTDSSIPLNVHIVYGHNAKNVFAPIYLLQAGDIVTLIDDNNSSVEYIFDHFESVLPTDTTVITNDFGLDTLILLTCEGTWNTTRRLAYLTINTN